MPSEPMTRQEAGASSEAAWEPYPHFAETSLSSPSDQPPVDLGSLETGSSSPSTSSSCSPYPRSRVTGRYYAEEALLSWIRPHRNEIEVLLKTFWLPAGVFCALEVGTYLVKSRSFFEALTDGDFELWPDFERIVAIHVWASVFMWLTAAVQILAEKARKAPELVWIHRWTGKAMLLSFYIIVFPTSLYLTAMQRVDWLSPAVGAVLLDTAFCTSYFLYRGWRVIRGSKSPRSKAIHGRLMQCGVMMSMSILPQRVLQFYLTAQLKSHHQINYTVSILVTAILFVLFGHFWEGPRGGIWLSALGGEAAEEAYGSAVPSALERRAWRGRWVAYALCYYLVRLALGTHHQAQDPAPTPAP